MASDETVSARAILAAVMDVRRRGTSAVLEELEQTEPDLASHLMENLSLLHQQLLNLSASPQRTRRIYREIERLCLVVVVALRNGHFELWQKTSSLEGPSASPTTDNTDNGTSSAAE